MPTWCLPYFITALYESIAGFAAVCKNISHSDYIQYIQTHDQKIEQLQDERGLF